MARPAARHPRPQQPRPEPGHLGDARAERRSEIRGVAGDPGFPLLGYAEQLGLKGIFVDRPEQLGSAWEEAFAADRPVVLEAYADPDIPPLPPHITLKQAKAFASTLWQGDPSEFKIIKESAKEIIEDFLPHGS